MPGRESGRGGVGRLGEGGSVPVYLEAHCLWQEASVLVSKLEGKTDTKHDFCRSRNKNDMKENQK